MRTLIVGAALCAAAGSLFAQAPAAPGAAPERDPLAAVWDSAFYAWDAGRYDDALAQLERLLLAPDGGRFLDSVALLTGELYRTTALADTASRTVWSPDGRYLLVERAGRGVVLFRSDADSLVPLGAVPATAAAFLGRSGRLAFLVPSPLGPSLRVRDLATGQEGEWARGESGWTGLFDGGADDRVLVLRTEGQPRPTRTDFLVLGPDGQARALVEGPGPRTPLFWGRGGAYLVFLAAGRITVLEVATGQTATFAGMAPSLAPNDSQLVFVGRSEGGNALSLLTLGQPAPTVVKRTSQMMAAPAVSPDGRRIAFQMALRDDWELFVIGADGTGERRLTHEIQDDLMPAWLSDDRLLFKRGESRHRRSFLLDPATGREARLFHNNTVRTMAMEYAWAPSPDGRRIAILAHRDGRTLDRPTAAYVIDLGRRVTRDEVLARVRTGLAAERDLRERGRRMYAPIAAEVRAAVAEVTTGRIWRTARELQEFDSRGTRMPGNRRTIDYLAAKLREYGYETEIQEFEARQGVRTANVVATLRGTANPELVYVVSAHFDSADEGPGADDNGTGTTSLLEAARVLATRPQPATIRFAFVTGEEIGMYGSREFVRRAQADSTRIVGALNNDTHGWSHDHRLDLSVRYSNAGIRDLQHAAAIGFTDLITYDGVRFQSSDGISFYQAYGDIVGGIGSYPMLASPHYHEPHDILETLNHQLVAEACKTTVASIMLMAASPAPLRDLRAAAAAGSVTATWTSAPERGVSSYRVAYGPESDPLRRTVVVRTPRAVLPDAQVGWRVAVKAVNARGLEGWDWSRAVVAAGN